MKLSFAGVHTLVQQNWDSKKTLKENYAHLGLIPRLMGSSGGQGSEANALYSAEKDKLSAAQTTTDLEGSERQDIEWRVIDRSKEHVTPMASDTMDEEIEPPKFIDDRVTALGAKVNLKKLRHIRLDVRPGQEDSNAVEEDDESVTTSTVNPIVAAMEEEAKTVVQIIRKPSGHEELVLSALERKHGQDYKAMARDMKLNKYQFTPGQLKKKFERVSLKQQGISRILKENSI